MTQINHEQFMLTAHGEVLRWFCKEYIPAHPRPWTFRDLRPDIAMIRFEDTDHGPFMGKERTLYGSQHLRSTPDTQAWFHLWNVLTHGATGCDGLTYAKVTEIVPHWLESRGGAGGERQPGFCYNYNSMPRFADRHRFFVPLNNTVVYDHEVGHDLLKDVPLILLTGVQVSEQTLEAIRQCVNDGSVCVAWGPLAARQGFDWTGGYKEMAVGKGKFVLTDDFSDRRVYDQMARFIGSPYEIRYRFKNHTVRLKMVDENKVDVVVDGPAAG
jgi:hypothetical protein